MISNFTFIQDKLITFTTEYKNKKPLEKFRSFDVDKLMCI